MKHTRRGREEPPVLESRVVSSIGCDNAATGATLAAPWTQNDE